MPNQRPISPGPGIRGRVTGLVGAGLALGGQVRPPQCAVQNRRLPRVVSLGLGWDWQVLGSVSETVAGGLGSAGETLAKANPIGYLQAF